jgi:hypothetical protein
MSTTDVNNPKYIKRLVQRLRFYWTQSRHKHPGHKDGIDLDLIHLRWLELDDNGYVALTNAGAQMIADTRQQNKKRQNRHDSLAQRLSQHLVQQGRICWLNKEMKVDYPDGHSEYVKPDIYSVKATKSVNNICPVIYEVKVTRSDFLSDLAKAKKWQNYHSLADYVIYAAPAGMIAPAELPAGCGLIVEEDNGNWNLIKWGKKMRTTLTAWHWMNLILKPHTGLSEIDYS